MDWHGLSAIILAVGISLAIIILSVGEFFHDGHISETEANTISTILGAGIGALATFLGGRLNGK